MSKTIAERLAAAKAAVAIADLTLGDCIDMDAALRKLDEGKFVLTRKIRYAIQRSLLALKPHVEIVAEVRRGLVAEYGTESDGKGGQRVTAERYPEFEAEMHALLAVPAEPAPAFHRFALDDLNVGADEDHNAIPATLLASLDPVLNYDRSAGEVA